MPTQLCTDSLHASIRDLCLCPPLLWGVLLQRWDGVGSARVTQIWSEWCSQESFLAPTAASLHSTSLRVLGGKTDLCSPARDPWQRLLPCLQHSLWPDLS